MKQIYATSAPGGGGGTPVTPAALTKTDDTNVTLTLGGTPATALLQAVSLTVGWTGTLADARIASAVYWNAKEPAITSGTVSQYWRGDKTWQTFPTIPTVSPAALTKVDDTNVTITLGGTPATSLLQAVSLTVGWSGTLADSRIASATTWNAKQNAITGAATTITTLDLTASRVLVSDASGKVATNSVTTTTLSYLDATSSIQTQLNKIGATVFFSHAATNPADLTTYYLGGLIGVIPTITSQPRFRIESPITGTFDRLRIVQNMTVGTTESSVIKLNNKTAATSVTLSSAYKYDNAVKLYTAIGLAVTQGDELEIEIITPTWVTNPLSAQQFFYGYIKQ